MAKVEPGGSSLLGRAVWLLLILSAVLAVYFGLSSLLLPFVGAPNLYTGIDRWLVPAAGALQLIAAAAAFLFAARRDLRGATLAIAAWLMLAWLVEPVTAEQTQHFRLIREFCIDPATFVETMMEE